MVIVTGVQRARKTLRKNASVVLLSDEFGIGKSWPVQELKGQTSHDSATRSALP